MILGDPIILGGGGGPSSSDAILTVTVPTGSTVTATKGGVTLTPTMWVQAADASLDCALFVIVPAQFDSANPWTVTATDGTNTHSKNVTIDANKQYDIDFSASFVIFGNGAINPALTVDVKGAGQYRIVNGCFQADLTSNGYGGVFFSPRIDITGYDTIRVVCESSYTGYLLPVGISNTEYAPTSNTENKMTAFARVDTGRIDTERTYNAALDASAPMYVGLTLVGTGTLSAYGYAQVTIKSLELLRALI